MLTLKINFCCNIKLDVNVTSVGLQAVLECWSVVTPSLLQSPPPRPPDISGLSQSELNSCGACRLELGRVTLTVSQSPFSLSSHPSCQPEPVLLSPLSSLDLRVSFCSQNYAVVFCPCLGHHHHHQPRLSRVMFCLSSQTTFSVIYCLPALVKSYSCSRIVRS